MLNSVNEVGGIKYYDGSDDAILNMNGKVLFTHELLQAFLNQGHEGRITFSGYWRASVRSWQQNFDYFLDPGVDSPPFVVEFLQLIKRSFMESMFVDAIFDFITLKNLDYLQAFSCVCADESRNNNVVTAVYDNCCKLMQAVLLRYPEMARHYQFNIDAMHHSGHSHCSPLYNHKRSIALQGVNVPMTEQNKHLFRHIQTSVAFLGQIRAFVYIRYVCLCPMQKMQ